METPGGDHVQLVAFITVTTLNNQWNLRASLGIQNIQFSFLDAISSLELEYESKCLRIIKSPILLQNIECKNEIEIKVL